MTNAQLLRRIKELEARVSELELHPQQVIHYHYAPLPPLSAYPTTPIYPTWPTITWSTNTASAQ